MPRRFLFVFMLVPFFFISSASGQENACSVVLNNGNLLTANSYRIEGGRIYLRYPVGEASFDLSQVMSVTRGDGSTEFLQDRGKPQKEDPRTSSPKPSPAQAASVGPVQPGRAGSKGWPSSPGPGRKDGPSAAFGRPAAEAPEDPHDAEKQRKFDDFFDRYWKADEKAQAEMEKQMDQVFFDYLDDPEAPPAGN